eukprot:4694083-Amphidinium_carterae.2
MSAKVAYLDQHMRDLHRACTSEGVVGMHLETGDRSQFLRTPIPAYVAQQIDSPVAELPR